MPRYRLTVEYDGRDFVGWQRQDNGPSVQAALEAAIAAFVGHEVAVFAAGRTDAGVHATAQTVHVDLDKAMPGDKVRDAANFHLKPQPVAVLSAVEVDDDFHARFSAIGRRYVYRIVNRRPPLTYLRGRAWHVAPPLDAEAMHRAARALVGRHDFTTFRSAQCQAKSPLKTLTALDVTRDGEAVRITALARSFLHNQVRSMVGSLKKVGEGRWAETEITAALAARDRSCCGPVAPPDGLYLDAVFYSDDADATEIIG